MRNKFVKVFQFDIHYVLVVVVVPSFDTPRAITKDLLQEPTLEISTVVKIDASLFVGALNFFNSGDNNQVSCMTTCFMSIPKSNSNSSQPIKK